MATSNPDLESFLKKVDNLESIMKGLNSEDETLRKDSLAKADVILQAEKEAEERKKKPSRDNTGINRTVINQRAFDEPLQPPPSAQNNSAVSQESFMKMMEADIEERKQRRKKNSAEATRLKELGNEQFKAGDYEKAVELYSQALGLFKDTTVLWTNRAQAYIKLGQYGKALEDCDWALRVFENCLKAYVHQGKAYLGLKEYEKALESFHKAMQVDPTKEKAIQEYIAEVERTQRADEQESSAQQVFESGGLGAKSLVELLDRVNKEDQLPLYYGGGLRVIKEVLLDTNERTLFRTNGGLQITETHPVIAKCFAAKPRSLSRDQIDMCTSTLETLRMACNSMEENCRRILEVSSLPEQLLTFLAASHKSCRLLRQASLTLLHTVSQEEAGREAICIKIDLTRLCSSLFGLLEVSAVCAYNAVGLLNNLALEKKFKIQLRDNIEDAILPTFEKLLLDGCSQPSVLPACITTVTNLSGDAHIRRKLLLRRQLWEALVKALKRYLGKLNNPKSVKTLHEVLGLLMNMTLEPSDLATTFTVPICTSCVELIKAEDEALQIRALGVMSHLLPKSTEGVVCVCGKGMVAHLVEFLKSDKEAYVKPALKCLTACTLHNEDARRDIVDHKGLTCLVNLLKHKDEMVFGNAALCLSHVSKEEKVCGKLTKTNIIQHLLVLARDGMNPQVQHNCAILIATLTKGDPRHLERLRELHGVEILLDVMKNVKE